MHADYAVKPNEQTFEALDQAITCIGRLTQECERIYREANGDARLFMFKQYHTQNIRKLWNIVDSLSLVFEANILALRLNEASSN